MTKRLIVVVLVSLFSIWLWAPDLPRVFGHPLGTPGFKVGHGNLVVAVDAGSPAERAGIRVGDRIDLAATPLHSRMLIVNANFQNLHPLQRFPVVVQSGNRRFTATISSEPESGADTATVLPRMAFALILLAAGIALLLLRPSRATWGFFVFSAFNPSATINTVIWYGPPAYQIAMTIGSSTAFSMASQLGALVFALYLLVKPPVAEWRRITEALGYVVAIAILTLSSWEIVSAVEHGTSLGVAANLVSLLATGLSIVPPLLLLITYASSDASARERIRWVIFAFTVNAFVFGVMFFTSEVATVTIPYWLWGTLGGIDAFTVAFTVLYAVLKHHIIDINVAISRALVYTILSAMAVGAFALVDLFFSRALSAHSAGLMVDIGLALVLGFFFNSAHARVDRFVDQLLFKNRHLAEKHLQTVIRGMPFALSEQQVDTMLVDEPRRSFALLGASLLGCADSGDFVMRYAGGSPMGVSIVHREDPLPTYLQGERCALRLTEHGSDLQALAVPVFSHGDLAAIAFYGLHINGTDFDAEEIALFEQLAVAAGNAYDRLEATLLRERVRELDLQITGALVK